MRTSHRKGIGSFGLAALTALVIGLLPGVSHAQTYYFTQGAATTATNVNTYVTDASGIAQFELGNTTLDFTDAVNLIAEQNAADLIQIYVEAGWATPPGNFSINESFPSYSGSQALWMNPDGATLTAEQPPNTPPLNVSAWSAGTWQAVIEFNIDDVNLYTGFFIEGRHYADDSVTLTINGNAVTIPSVNGPNQWQFNPPAASSASIDPSYLQTGTNVMVFTISNTNPETPLDEGPSGLMAYGRIGATLVPEPSGIALIGLAAVGLIGRRRARRR